MSTEVRANGERASLDLRVTGVMSTTVTLFLHPHVLTPTSYAITFAKLLNARNLSNCRVLDVGCGSGFLSIIAAKQGARVWAVDISPTALEITNKNAERNDVALEVVVESDALRAFLPYGEYSDVTFDLIICNNPSLPGKEASDRDRNSYIEWNENGSGRDLLDAILIHGRRLLTPHGSLITHTSSEQGWECTAKLLSDNWNDWETLLAMEASVDSEYYDEVRDLWLSQGSAYKKRGRTFHIVTLFEAYAETRKRGSAGEDKLLSQRLIREVLDL
ncbi:MAG TPA: 50S ribosomal protein L11 methyltransferase [Candidatus Acidoferrales bacterium]|nr:50S ribosomal protein L11 methyltransferase [Candidatus Acidoferrales bacterium]